MRPERARQGLDILRFHPGTTMGLRLVQEVALNQYQGSFMMRRRNHGTVAEILINEDKLRGEA